MCESDKKTRGKKREASITVITLLMWVGADRERGNSLCVSFVLQKGFVEAMIYFKNKQKRKNTY